MNKNTTDPRVPELDTINTCLVIGASSGIDHATALELLSAGYAVYGAARRMEKWMHCARRVAESFPAVVAKAIRAAIASTTQKPRYAVGYLAGLMLTVEKYLPDRLFDRLMTNWLKDAYQRDESLSRQYS